MGGKNRTLPRVRGFEIFTDFPFYGIMRLLKNVVLNPKEIITPHTMFHYCLACGLKASNFFFKYIEGVLSGPTPNFFTNREEVD